MFDRNGDATVLLKDQIDAAIGPHFSPDGKRIAFQKGNAGIWVYDIARNVATPMTLDIRGHQSRRSGPPTASASPTPLLVILQKARATEFSGAVPTAAAPKSRSLMTPSSTHPPRHGCPTERRSAFSRLSPKDYACCEVWTITLDADGKPGAPKPFLSHNRQAPLLRSPPIHSSRPTAAGSSHRRANRLFRKFM